jgi:phosphopantetheinyl transferase
MPLIQHKSVPGGGSLALWNITEQADEMLEVLRSQGIYADIPFFRNPGRLKEWLAARLLMAELGVKAKIVYNTLGKPNIEGEHAHISISHSGEYVGVIMHREHPVGIDIEKTGDRIHRVSSKFVGDNEWAWLQRPGDAERLYVIWGAKECAFKIYGLGEIDFRDNLEVERFDMEQEGITRIHFKKGDIHCIYQVFFQYLNDVMVTYAIAS